MLFVKIQDHNSHNQYHPCILNADAGFMIYNKNEFLSNTSNIIWYLRMVFAENVFLFCAVSLSAKKWFVFCYLVELIEVRRMDKIAPYPVLAKVKLL